MFVLAHFSDPHLSPLPRPGLLELAGKRVIGFANWRLRRRLEHRMDVLDALLRDLAAQAVDHIVVTGDLVNIALPGEFAAAQAFLGRVGPPERVTFVPGNHDAYVRAAAAFRRRHWSAYMAGDDSARPAAAEFPFVRRRGPLALIGLSTAVPTGPFMAWGRLDRGQLDALDGELARLAHENVFRVVLLHHPPVATHGDRMKRLINAEEFRHVLRRRGADLILHGHTHEHSLAWLEGPGGRVPVVGVPSASAVGQADDRAGYNLYRVEAADGGWHCALTSRGLADGDDLIVERPGHILHPASAQ